MSTIIALVQQGLNRRVNAPKSIVALITYFLDRIEAGEVTIFI
jgi:hypothetical protein